jgi:hypothetical protein
VKSIDRFWGTTALMAIGLVLSGCGVDVHTGGSVAPSTVTVTSPTASPSPQTSGGVSYTGTTSQGLPISLAATSNAVLALRFGWRAHCEDGQIHSNTISLGSAPITDGSFTIDSTLETGGVAHVEGKIDGDTASGQLSRSKGSAFGTDCVATGIAWQAQAGSG